MGGHIDRMPNLAPQQEARDDLGRFEGHHLLRFVGRGTQVRRGEHFRVFRQLVLGGRGFFFEHVDGGGRDLAGVKPLDEGRFIDDPAASTVHQTHTLTQLGDPFLVDQAACLVGERRVEREEVAMGAASRPRSSGTRSVLGGLFGGEERVVTQNPHLKRDGPLGHGQADPTETDDAERLAGQLCAGERFAVPLARVHAGVGGTDVAGHAQQQSHRVLGGGDRVPRRGVHHDDPLARGGLGVDVVDPDPRTSDRFQSRLPLENVRGQCDTRANDRRVRPLEGLDEVGPFRPGR